MTNHLIPDIDNSNFEGQVDHNLSDLSSLSYVFWLHSP